MASTARDPVCGALVDPSLGGGRKVDYKHASFYFCSDTCQTRFRKHPDDYAHLPPA